MKPSVRGIHSDNQKPERRPFGRAPRPVTRATGPALFIRVCLLLALMGAWLPASLAAAQAPDGGAPDGIAAPQAAIWSSYPIFGGNMESMASDPFNGQVFYVGTESAGVYKTTNAGATWQPARAGLPPAAKVISLAVDPQNSNTLYAGTDAVGIIWKSQDTGATWTNITHNMQYGTSVYADEAYNIVVDPHNSNIVYVGLGGYNGQIYKINRRRRHLVGDGQRHPPGQRQLHKAGVGVSYRPHSILGVVRGWARIRCVQDHRRWR